MSVVLAVLTGVLIFLIGQFVVKLIIDPVVNFKKSLGSLSSIILRSQVEIVHAEADKELVADMKKSISEVLANMNAIPFYDVCEKVFSLPRYADILPALKTLNVCVARASQCGYEKSEILGSKSDTLTELNDAGKLLKIALTYSFDE